MQLNRPRSEIVVAMTIAEVFLLLVFMVWYVSVSGESGPGQVSIVRAERDRLKRENEALRNERDKLRAQAEQFQAVLKFWESRFGMFPPRNDGEVQTFVHELGRGKPKCQDQNVIAQGSVIQGAVSILVLTEPVDLANVEPTD